MTDKGILRPESMEDRDYQEKAWTSMINFAKKWLRRELTNEKGIDLWTTMPIWMATGSGKTYTVGDFLNYMYVYRDRLKRLAADKEKYNINLLALNDRITLVNQLKTDFITGRDGKDPMINTTITGNATIKVFHSKADNTEKEQYQDGADVTGSGKDHLYFSTFQTALTGLDTDETFDVIVIDEGHHLAADNYMKVVKREFYKTWSNRGIPPLIIPMSATMEPILHLVNDPVVKFSLPEYIASDFSPEITYNLITHTGLNQTEIDLLYQEIQTIAKISNIKEKKSMIAAFKIKLEEKLAKFVDLKDLVDDLLTRVEELDHTIIFASSIDEANEIAQTINDKTGDKNTAVALHSKIDEADETVLNRYKSGEHKIIVAVDKLNEGIDMPQTKNVIFWRNTNSAIVFQQQFGRGLRGKKVNFYDYVGTMRNLARIQNLNDAAAAIPEEEISRKKENMGSERPRRGIDILFGDVKEERGVNNALQLQDVIMQMQTVEKEAVLTKEEVIELFKEQGDINHWKKLGYEQRLLFKLRGYGLIALGTIVGTGGDTIDQTEDRYKMLEEIYGEKIERLSKEKIVRWFTMQGDINFRKNKGFEERKNLKFEELGLVALSNKVGGGYNPINNSDDWLSMLEAIFNVQIERLTKERIVSWFKEQGDINFWTKKNSSERKDIKILDYKIIQIGSTMGLKGRAITTNHWYDLLEIIYGEKIEREKAHTEQEFISLYKKQLKDKGIIDRETLLNFGVMKFRKERGVVGLGRVINKSIKNGAPSIDDLIALAEKMGFEDIKPADLFRKKLADKKIFDRLGLRKFGVKDRKSVFGTKDLGKVLGRKIYDTPKMTDIEQLANILHLPEIDYTNNVYLKEYLIRLKDEGITDKASLLKYGSSAFQKNLGVYDMGIFLGKKHGHVTVSLLEQLGDILFSVEKK